MNIALDIGACLLAMLGFALHLAIYGPDEIKETT